LLLALACGTEPRAAVSGDARPGEGLLPRFLPLLPKTAAFQVPPPTRFAPRFVRRVEPRLVLAADTDTGKDLVGQQIRAALENIEGKRKGNGRAGRFDERSGFYATNQAVLSAKGDPDEFAAVIQTLMENKTDLDGVNVATILHAGAKFPDAFSAAVLVYLAQTLRNPKIRFTARCVGNSMYGLQGLGPGREVRSLVAALTKKIEACQEPLKAQELAQALYGLKNLRNNADVRRLVAVLAYKVEQSPARLSAQEVAMSLYGLRHKRDSEEVRWLVEALSVKVQQCEELFTQRAVAMSLMGLHYLSDSAEMNDLAAALTPKIVKCSDRFHEQTVANALSGLHSLSGASIEVRGLVAALTSKVLEYRGQLSAKAIGSAVFGLQSLVDSEEARALVAALTPKVEECSEQFNAQAAGNAVAGLRSLGDSAEALGLMAALTRKVESSAALDVRALIQALGGLESHADSSELRALLAALTRKVSDVALSVPDATAALARAKVMRAPSAERDALMAALETQASKSTAVDALAGIKAGEIQAGKATRQVLEQVRARSTISQPPDDDAPPPEGFSWDNQYTFDAPGEDLAEEDPIEPSAEPSIPLDLASLSRKELQVVAKEHGVRANMKWVHILAALKAKREELGAAGKPAEAADPKPAEPKPARTARGVKVTSDEQQFFKLLFGTIKHFNLKTKVRIAGGWVRDKVLGGDSQDLDIVVDDMPGVAFAKKVAKYANTSACGKEYGTMSSVGVVQANPEQSKHLDTATFTFGDLSVDVNQFRPKTYAKESRTPKTRVGTILEDAERRDFTLNALYYNIHTHEVEDYVGGLQDLERKLLRTPLPPAQTFADDPLRILRAVRFGARFDFALEPDLVVAAKAAAGAGLPKVSRERVGLEVEKMLRLGLDPGLAALELIGDLGLYHDVFGSGLPEGAPALPADGAAAGLAVARRLDFGEAGRTSGARFRGRRRRMKAAERRALLAAYLSPVHGTQVQIGKKTLPFVSVIVREALMWSKVDAKGVALLLAGAARMRDARPEHKVRDIGLALRLVRAEWRIAWRLAEALGWVHEDLEAFVKDAGLEECWAWRPAADGAALQALGVPKGPAIGEHIEAQMIWRLEHPGSTAEEQLAAAIARVDAEREREASE